METDTTEEIRQGSMSEGVAELVKSQMEGSESGDDMPLEDDAGGENPLGDAPLQDSEPPLEAPQKWGNQYKERFNSLGTLEGGRDYQQAMLDLYNENQTYTTSVEEERAKLRRAQEQWQDAVAPYEPLITSTGTTPQAAFRQAMGMLQSLRTNPQDAIMKIAQSSGVDLNQLLEGQPYVDPSVQALQNEIQQLRWAQKQSLEQQQNERITQVERQINHFASETDSNGSPAHPHFENREVQDMMSWLIQRDNSLTLKSAYGEAVKRVPGLTAKEAAEKSRQEAAEKAAKAAKETVAATRPHGKTSGTAAPLSQREAVAAAYRKSA